MGLELAETRKNLEICLGEDLRKEYFAVLRQWFIFNSPITKTEFDSQVRKLLVTEEQVRCHNYFILALMAKRSTNKAKNTRNTSDKGVFEAADFTDYIQPASPTSLPPSEYELRSASSEFFMPDPGFVSTRIAITTWENGLDGASESVTDLIVHACQVFVKNLIMAMVSRKKGYRVRDGKLQYSFNLSVPDPFVRHQTNASDDVDEVETALRDEDDPFVSKYKPLEQAEQRTALAYSSAKAKRGDNLLTVKLLYDTLRENPKILGLNNMRSINLVKLNLQLED